MNRPTTRSTHPWMRRRARRALSVLIMVAGVVVTVATSPEEAPDFGIRFTEPLVVNVWESTTVMGEGEAEAHVFLSFPTDLLETHESEITFRFDINLDSTREENSPMTNWTLRVGDASGPTITFPSPLTEAQPPGFFGPWQFVEEFTSAPVPIAADCDGEGCIPCDPGQTRCDVVLTVERAAMAYPRMRVSINGEMLQTDLRDPEPSASSMSRF